MKGTLRTCSENPRYFTDDTGKAIYLTGTHTWSVFQDAVTADGKVVSPFDYDAYLREMKDRGFNFLRLWNMENAIGIEKADGNITYTFPMPYKTVGTRDQGRYPVFDLEDFNDDFFYRLRERVQKAADLEIYVSVMLFEGWSVDSRAGSVWEGHPFNKENNINHIDGNPGVTEGAALSGENDKNPFYPQEHILVHTLAAPKITYIQKQYVKKILETLNDLDNVMYEIANEALRWSRSWQYEMIRFIHEEEKRMPKQHPVWMSHVVPAQNESLWISAAEAVSPGVESTADDYCVCPPAGDGSKIIIADTDHLGGIWGTFQWAWKSFMRGLNPIFMDDMGKQTPNRDKDGLSQMFGRYQYGLPENWQEDVKNALSRCAAWARRIHLTKMKPVQWVSSTGYCLADLGNEYLIYQPESGQFKVSLYGADNYFSVEWYQTEAGKTYQGQPFKGGMAVDFTPPCRGSVLLYLKAAE